MKCPKCGEEISEADIMPVIISTGEEFEQFLCDKINAQEGMYCKKTKASGDQGVDLIVGLGGKKIAIQCKLYTGTVGNDAVQEVLAGRILYRCDIGCVVTNSTYTSSAKELAKGTDIVLLHYKDLLSYLKNLNGGEASGAENQSSDAVLTREKFDVLLQQWIDQVPKDDDDPDFAEALEDFTHKVVDAVLGNPKECLPTQGACHLFAIRSTLIAQDAHKAGCLLIEERWLRYASLFYSLAGIDKAKLELDKQARLILKERYKGHETFFNEFCDVPTTSYDNYVIFSSFAEHWYFDEYRILFGLFQHIEFYRLSKEDQEVYLSIKKNYEIRKAQLDKKLAQRRAEVEK